MPWTATSALRDGAQSKHIVCRVSTREQHSLAMQAASKQKKKEEQQGKREDPPQEQSAAVLARGRLGHAIWDWFSPRLMVAGGGLFMSLSRWGILPSVRFLGLRS